MPSEPLSPPVRDGGGSSRSGLSRRSDQSDRSDRSTARKWRNVLLLGLAELLAMGLWFSASAVVPQLTQEWNLGDSARSWMTMSVQLGFVAGALLSALLNLADRIPAARFLAVSALLGAVFNAAIALAVDAPGPALVLRFLTGATLAGVYPPGMKLVASWCKRDRGFGIGLLIGAVTFGSALPHLLNAASGSGAGMPPWRPVLLVASSLAAVGAVVSWVALEFGPHLARTAPFDIRFATAALSHKPTRLANYGYLGHMWELYAVWAWAPILLLEAYAPAGWSAGSARWAGFAVIAIGAPGCLLAGVLADRFGRTVVAGASLLVSGACALVAGAFVGAPGVLTVICLIWGFAVVADSAQFSAAVSELTDPRYVGTALTVQTSLGFLLTLVTIRLVPEMVERFGWRATLPVLALGPVFGIVSMARLRAQPESSRMAAGRR